MICGGCGGQMETAPWGSVAMHHEGCPGLDGGIPVHVRIGDLPEMLAGTVHVREEIPASTAMALFLRGLASLLEDADGRS